MTDAAMTRFTNWCWVFCAAMVSVAFSCVCVAVAITVLRWAIPL